MTTGERIRARRKELGLSLAEVGRALGVDKSTVHRYETEEIENIQLRSLVPLAEVLRVTPAYLAGWEGKGPPTSVITKRVPLLGDIAAGVPIWAEEDCRTYVEVGLDGELSIDFCLRVSGDSMIDARINDGDLVFVRQQPCVENGEIAVVLIDNEATLKRFYKDDASGLVILKPENSRYQPSVYAARDFKNITILGKAVLFQSKL